MQLLRKRKKAGLFLFNMALEKNKVMATQILERAQPSLKIKGVMTFNAKKHTETEKR